MSSGLTTYTHFCKGVKQGVVLFNGDNVNEPCPVCASKNKQLKSKKKGCCKHEAKIVKVDVANKYSGLDFPVKFWGDAIPNESLGALFDLLQSYPEPSQSTHFPSKIPIRSTPLYIFHCVYRI